MSCPKVIRVSSCTERPCRILGVTVVQDDYRVARTTSGAPLTTLPALWEVTLALQVTLKGVQALQWARGHPEYGTYTSSVVVAG